MRIPDKKLRTVVLGYVLSPLGHAALEAAITECARRDAKLLVINSTRADRTVDKNYAFSDDLATLHSILQESGVTYEVRQFVSEQLASDDVIEAADEVDAELIVIGVRRRSPVGKMLMGSDSQRILLQADCNVLAVKA
ncbi:universal stress protein UspA [Arthrobacter sp. MYb227]|uniref:universal stress protein n=1 Tax=Arthrobacter sp. MYb227 TaxID=1848601 RepID=UPI000CFBCD17|nr:universal stress protein [Arthrobacter sp. MYb227]PQZ92946.1 universal stress protein UspA [Arthrobacter sp. MYb227]